MHGYDETNKLFIHYGLFIKNHLQHNLSHLLENFETAKLPVTDVLFNNLFLFFFQQTRN